MGKPNRQAQHKNQHAGKVHGRDVETKIVSVLGTQREPARTRNRKSGRHPKTQQPAEPVEQGPPWFVGAKKLPRHEETFQTKFVCRIATAIARTSAASARRPVNCAHHAAITRASAGQSV